MFLLISDPSVEKERVANHCDVVRHGYGGRVVGRIRVCWRRVRSVASAWFGRDPSVSQTLRTHMQRIPHCTGVSGAVGCSLLAYILPCLIHLKVKGRIMRVRLIIKDLLIIFVSAVASVSTLVVIIGEIAKGTIK